MCLAMLRVLLLPFLLFSFSFPSGFFFFPIIRVVLCRFGEDDWWRWSQVIIFEGETPDSMRCVFAIGFVARRESNVELERDLSVGV